MMNDEQMVINDKHKTSIFISVHFVTAEPVQLEFQRIRATGPRIGIPSRRNQLGPGRYVHALGKELVN